MIVRVTMDKMEGENKSTPNKELKINSSPTITNLEKKKLPGIEKDLLAVKFTFETKYEPDFGRITLSGELIYQTENLDKLIEDWKQTKHLPKDIALDVLNGIFRFSLTKMITYSSDLSLPPPIKFPTVKAEDATQEGKAQ